MKSLILPLAILLTIALVAALFVQERQAQYAQTKITELTQKLLKAEQRAKGQAAEIASLQKSQESLKAEAEALRERMHAIAQAQATGSASDLQNHSQLPSPTPAEPKPGSAGMIREMMSDPRLRQAMIGQQIAAIRKRYQAFAQAAGLTPEETGKLFEILASREEARIEAAGGGQPESSRDYQQELKNFLGDQRFGQLQEYEKSLPAASQP